MAGPSCSSLLETPRAIKGHGRASIALTTATLHALLPHEDGSLGGPRALGIALPSVRRGIRDGGGHGLRGVTSQSGFKGRGGARGVVAVCGDRASTGRGASIGRAAVSARAAALIQPSASADGGSRSTAQSCRAGQGGEGRPSCGLGANQMNRASHAASSCMGFNAAKT